MRRRVNQSIIFFLIATLVIVPFGATALAQDQTQHKERSTEAMLADFVFVRPVGIVASAVGTVFYIVSLPFSAMGGNTEQVRQKFVAAPFEYTFKRPLGEF